MLHQAFLEVVDFPVGAQPVGLRAVALDALHQHAAVPGAVEDGELPTGGNVPPEAPQVGVGQLLLGRRGDGDDAVLARIQRLGDPADGAALACRVVAFEYRHQRMLAHALVVHERRQARLLVGQLGLVGVLLQRLAQVQAFQQTAGAQAGGHRHGMRRRTRPACRFQGRAQALQKNLAHRHVAVIAVAAVHHVPGRIVPAAAADDVLGMPHHLVVGLALLPVQRAEFPAVQRIVGQALQACFHLRAGQVEPELEDQRALVAQHALQALRALDRLIELGVVDLVLDPRLQHLAVPVAEEDAGAPLGRQLPPVAPGRRPGQLLVALHIEGGHLDEARIHPFGEPLDRIPLAGALDAIDQDDHREIRLLAQLVLDFQQGLAQRGQFGFVGFLVDGVADFGGFEHG